MRQKDYQRFSKYRHWVIQELPYGYVRLACRPNKIDCCLPMALSGNDITCHRCQAILQRPFKVGSVTCQPLGMMVLKTLPGIQPDLNIEIPQPTKTNGTFTKEVLEETFKQIEEQRFTPMQQRMLKEVLTPNEVKQYLELNKIPRYGWYSRADQPADQPDYDPPHDSMCPICEKPITPDDVRTHSMMYVNELEKKEGSGRCYFYRTHKTCDEALTGEQRNKIDSKMWKEIEE